MAVQKWFQLNVTYEQLGSVFTRQVFHAHRHPKINQSCFETERKSVKHKLQRKKRATQWEIQHQQNRAQQFVVPVLRFVGEDLIAVIRYIRKSLQVLHDGGFNTKNGCLRPSIDLLPRAHPQGSGANSSRNLSYSVKKLGTLEKI